MELSYCITKLSHLLFSRNRRNMVTHLYDLASELNIADSYNKKYHAHIHLICTNPITRLISFSLQRTYTKNVPGFFQY